MFRLLFVGRDPSTEEQCRRELGEEGFEVEVASDSQEAVSKVKDDSPDLVILDLCMPIDEGVACLESVRDCDRSLPVVLRTSHPTCWGDFRLWSADSVVEQSEDLSALKAAVRNLLPPTPA